jgi:copper chaperone CopZ
VTKVVLDVPAIDCAHCSRAITRALQPQAGVERVRVDVPTQKVYLELDEGRISLDRVKELLEEADYPVEAVAPA